MIDCFVYRWRNQHTGEWYIGYHRGTESDGYICSSRIARPRIQGEPGWRRKILRWGTKSEMIALEHRLLTRLQAKTNPRSLNRSNGGRDFAPIGRWDHTIRVLGYDLDKMTDAQEIARLYQQEINTGDTQRICLFDCWLIHKLVQPGRLK